MEDFSNWSNKTVLDQDGNKIGTIGELYVDDDTDRPAWATVKTGLFGTKENFIPVSLAHVQGDDVVVDTTADQVKNAPQIDVEQILNADEERALYDYYGQDWGTIETTPQAAGTAAAEEADTAEGPDTADNVIPAGTDDTGQEEGAMTAAEARAAQKGATAVATSQEAADNAAVDDAKDKGVIGQYRLRRYKVRDEKTITVPVEREEVKLEPIDDGTSDQV